MGLSLSPTIAILALICALGATVMAFLFIVPEKKRKNLNKIGKLLHDILNFKFLIIEKILQALYIFCTAFVMMAGFFMLFYFKSYDYYLYSKTYWGGGWGLLMIIGGPIVIRLAYEGMMMMILLIKNVIQINNKIKTPEGEDGKKEEADIFGVNLPFSAPEKKEAEVEVKPAPVVEEPVKPVAAFCSHCGARVDGGAFCSVCGNKL